MNRNWSVICILMLLILVVGLPISRSEDRRSRTNPRTPEDRSGRESAQKKRERDREEKKKKKEKDEDEEVFGDNWFSALATTRIPDYEFDFCLEALADGPLDFACLAVSTR